MKNDCNHVILMKFLSIVGLSNSDDVLEINFP